MTSHSDHVLAHYQLVASAADASAAARRIAYEQTVELPAELVIDPDILSDVVGRVEAVEPIAGTDDRHLATIAYPVGGVAPQLPTLLNLLFGNASLLKGTRLVDFELPESWLVAFNGPRYGIAGLRALLGVDGRPLLATALKPRGLAHAELASLAGAFARGGGDIVKDDQNLADDFETFKRRAERCHAAVEEANAASGRRCLYLPHASARHADLERCFEFAAASGMAGLLVCPMIIGLEAVRELAARYPLVMMAHPALTSVDGAGGDRGFAADVLWGDLFRLAGADISIFPHAGGRFPFTRDDSLAVSDRLKRPLGAIKPAFPAPAGGMDIARVEDLCTTFGADSVLLVGGALFGLDPDLEVATRRFADAIRANAPEQLSPPGAGPERSPGYRLGAGADYNWSSRDSSPYKDAQNLAFKGVRRVELVGKFGEPTRTDLRYFEVQPGGFSSLERHVHGHIVIGARGTGTLVLGDTRHTLAVNDVGFIAPLQPHQLRNETDEPFGFFCIVDHLRDRPMA